MRKTNRRKHNRRVRTMAHKLIALGLLLLATTSDAKETPFKGDYPTGSIRYIWMVCAESMRSRFTEEGAYWQVCDCVVDALRKRLNEKEYFGAEPKKQYEITFRVTTTCLQQILPPKRSIWSVNGNVCSATLQTIWLRFILTTIAPVADERIGNVVTGLQNNR